MGLDTVELVMAVEEHFDIHVPDDVASKLDTVGLLHKFVVAQLQRGRLLPVDEAAVFGELRELICKQGGVEPERWFRMHTSSKTCVLTEPYEFWANKPLVPARKQRRCSLASPPRTLGRLNIQMNRTGSSR